MFDAHSPAFTWHYDSQSVGGRRTAGWRGVAGCGGGCSAREIGFILLLTRTRGDDEGERSVPEKTLCNPRPAPNTLPLCPTPGLLVPHVAAPRPQRGRARARRPAEDRSRARLRHARRRHRRGWRRVRRARHRGHPLDPGAAAAPPADHQPHVSLPEVLRGALVLGGRQRAIRRR